MQLAPLLESLGHNGGCHNLISRKSSFGRHCLQHQIVFATSDTISGFEKKKNKNGKHKLFKKKQKNPPPKKKKKKKKKTSTYAKFDKSQKSR